MVKRPFAVFDIDGTLIRWQLYHALADLLLSNAPDPAAGKTYQTIQAAFKQWKRRAHEESYQAYEEQLVKAYEQVVQGLSVRTFTQAAETVFQEYKDQVYRYSRNLLRELKAKGYILFAISGSDDIVIGKMADYYGFDDYIGVHRVQAAGRFTGEVKHTWGAKQRLLNELVAKHGLDFARSIGVGDSEGDIGMLELVEQPIAFNPSKLLFKHASTQGWKIVLERKNMIYELEPKDGAYQLAKTNV